MIDAEADRHIWAQNFDRKLVRAMTLQSEVAAEVAAALSVRLAAACEPRRRRKTPQHTTCESESLAAHPGLRQPLTEFQKTLAWLDEALARDPGFVLAYFAPHD